MILTSGHPQLPPVFDYHEGTVTMVCHPYVESNKHIAWVEYIRPAVESGKARTLSFLGGRDKSLLYHDGEAYFTANAPGQYNYYCDRGAKSLREAGHNSLKLDLMLDFLRSGSRQILFVHRQEVSSHFHLQTLKEAAVQTRNAVVLLGVEMSLSPMGFHLLPGELTVHCDLVIAVHGAGSNFITRAIRKARGRPGKGHLFPYKSTPRKKARRVLTETDRRRVQRGASAVLAASGPLNPADPAESLWDMLEEP